MSDLITTQKALSDIEVLKKNLATRETPALGIESLDTHLMLNVGTLAICLLLAVFETMSGMATSDLMASTTNPDLQIEGTLNILVILSLMVLMGYAVVFYGAARQKKTVDVFTSRYFKYFRNASALSDIFVKFCCFAFVVLAGKPEWIAPLLLLFTGDVILQGRYFILSTLTSVAFALACFITAFAMFIEGYVSVGIPLWGFALINAVSLCNILRYRKNLGSQE